MNSLPQRVLVIDSGGANIHSVVSAFDRMGVKAHFTRSEEEIRSADRLILPGVGAAGDAMARLREAGLDLVIPSLVQPVLGICLGMQILFAASEEGNVSTLGVIHGDVRRFPSSAGLSVPHMGWNTVAFCQQEHPLLAGIEKADEFSGQAPHFYFVHSYYAPILEGLTIGVCDYGIPFTAIVSKDNFMGCQFHPERSGPVGQKILQNFMALK